MPRFSSLIKTRYVLYTYTPGPDARWERGPWYVNLDVAQQQRRFYLDNGIAAVIETEDADLAK